MNKLMPGLLLVLLCGLPAMAVQAEDQMNSAAKVIVAQKAPATSSHQDNWRDVVAPAAWGGVTWTATPQYTTERASAAPVNERKGASLAVSPEPGTAVLLVLALLAFLMHRNRKA